jgi:hypothetical protein
MRLAYADPPYPGKAHLYPEKTEVDHAELIGRLCEYDGWALSTDETNLAYVLGLCPPRVRVLAWCRSDAPPMGGHPSQSWEPVVCRPARTAGDTVRSYFVGTLPLRGFTAQGDWLVGSKTEAFCEWVIRCLAARPEDTMDDLFPGTRIMSRVWDRWQRQPPLFSEWAMQSPTAVANITRRSQPQLPGMPGAAYSRERRLT